MVEIKIIRSDGKQFLADGSYQEDAYWGILGLTGIGEVEIELFTEKKAIGDGDVVTGKRYVPRDLGIIAKVKHVEDDETLRSYAIQFFNKKYTFRIYITYGNAEKWVEGELSACKIAKDKEKHQTQLECNILCPDPFFKSIDSFSRDIASLTPKFHFPYVSVINKGFQASVFTFAKAVLIENTGDEDTSMKVTITATGQVVNPKVVKDDYFVRIKDTLVEGDEVIIDTGTSQVTKNGENMMRMVDKLSTFTDMILTVGENTIGFDADNGSDNMKVLVERYILYGGVVL